MTRAPLAPSTPRTVLALHCLLLALTIGSFAQESTPDARSASAASLEAEVAALRCDDVPWRGIDWRICLLEGLAESRRVGKPVLLWVFIDRPVDDARC